MTVRSRIEKKSRYWNIPRVVFTYVTARVFYNIFMVLWSGVGKYLLYMIVGLIIASLL